VGVGGEGRSSSFLSIVICYAAPCLHRSHQEGIQYNTIPSFEKTKVLCK
jgi:hypothetical protein